MESCGWVVLHGGHATAPPLSGTDYLVVLAVAVVLAAVLRRLGVFDALDE